MNEDEGFVFEFDKFISDITSREALNAPQPPAPTDVVTPQREYIQKYRELPQNRTTWRR